MIYFIEGIDFGGLHILKHDWSRGLVDMWFIDTIGM